MPLINKENKQQCPICRKQIRKKLEYGHCKKWFYYRCESTTEEKAEKNSNHTLCRINKHQVHGKKIKALEGKLEAKKKNQLL